MITYRRVSAFEQGFHNLIVDLDKDLWSRYPNIQQNFTPFNTVDDTFRVILAYDKDPVGCGCFRPMKERYTVEIKRMYVGPAYRNRSIGKSMLSHLEQWAKESGFTISKLETGINQPEAIAAYEKSGYIRIPNFPPYVDIEESICMQKILK